MNLPYLMFHCQILVMFLLTTESDIGDMSQLMIGFDYFNIYVRQMLSSFLFLLYFAHSPLVTSSTLTWPQYM